ncbi:hypothetical protein C9374_014036 [Naegleria lovaniensis]|uniref:Uncharacterized protein n=1 Tax=Naegleria lovaniensis TaxID=51637 RepID=A0AA88GW20_NAELO|nr:uncharacterized protein C9374_014036 [Naegleria lovaniensis]KAG2389476.1 hypothetical protein C9374_014036 [Naegleria lovaniensis]
MPDHQSQGSNSRNSSYQHSNSISSTHIPIYQPLSQEIQSNRSISTNETILSDQHSQEQQNLLIEIGGLKSLMKPSLKKKRDEESTNQLIIDDDLEEIAFPNCVHLKKSPEKKISKRTLVEHLHSKNRKKNVKRKKKKD